MATHGIVIDAEYDRLGVLAKRVEDAGFDTVWVAETARDSLIQAAVLATATSTVTIGTNITLAFPRSPTVTAMQAWDLDALSGGRFTIGLGSQVKRIIEERFSADFSQPAKRMGEYVQAMRAVWEMERGVATQFAGEIYQVLRPGINGLGSAATRRHPRVCVAAVGPLMVAAAAAYADGILGHPFTSDKYVAATVAPTIDDALAAHGRSRDDFTLNQGVIVCISDDRDTAIREAKQQIGFYGTTPNYTAVFASYGDEELTTSLQRVFRQTKGDPAALAQAVPDDVVHRYAVAGTPDEVRDQLAVFDTLADHLILGGAWYQVPRARADENMDAIIDVFGRSAG
jgi:probable F420-dependent oxidoreductase